MQQGDTPVAVVSVAGVRLLDLMDRPRLEDWTRHLRQLEATQFRPAVSA
jgi:hypothetical protein